MMLRLDLVIEGPNETFEDYWSQPVPGLKHDEGWYDVDHDVIFVIEQAISNCANYLRYNKNAPLQRKLEVTNPLVPMRVLYASEKDYPGRVTPINRYQVYFRVGPFRGDGKLLPVNTSRPTHLPTDLSDYSSKDYS